MRVCGGGLTDEGLKEGDRLVVEPRRRPRAGEMVLVEIDGVVTVKRYARSGSGRGLLLPAGPALLPLARPASTARIQGVVVDILRKRVRHSPRGQQAQQPCASDLARDLRALRKAYAATTHPRLRRALLREAERIDHQLRRSAPTR